MLEIVCLASESCRASEKAVTRPTEEGHTLEGEGAEAEDFAELQEDAKMNTQDKGKQRADVLEEPVEQARHGHRRRRFSLSFNFKGMLNLDDIEERPNENPPACVHDHDHQTADWDTLVSASDIECEMS